MTKPLSIPAQGTWRGLQVAIKRVIFQVDRPLHKYPTVQPATLYSPPRLAYGCLIASQFPHIYCDLISKSSPMLLSFATLFLLFQVMADARAEANRMTALREAAINATLNHPHIVTTYTYDMQPLGDTQTSGRGFLDWQMYIIQVGLPLHQQVSGTYTVYKI